MKIGVSGASGQLGQAVVKELVARGGGHEVVAISRTPKAAAGVEARQGDYDQPESLGAAYAGGEEHEKGSLTVGKLGDAVVLREDLLAIDSAKIRENGVQATIIGGKIVYGEV